MPENRKQSIGIIGGGIMGMTLALRLSKQGFPVTLIEKDSKLGGLLSPGKIGDYSWDRFYHVILPSDRNVLSLLEEFNLSNRICWSPTNTRFFANGSMYSLSNIIDFLKFPPLSLLDKIRLGFTIFYASRIRSGKRLENISAAEWLTRLSGRRTFRRIWLPLLKSKLGDKFASVNASFIWAIISRMYSARSSGVKKEMFGYVEGGYSTVIDRFEERLKANRVEIIRNFEAGRIESNGKGAKVYSLAGNQLNFDRVILTIPSNQIANICSQLSSSEKQRLRSVQYQGIICTALLLRKPLTGSYITNITDENIPLTAVIEMTAVVERKNFGGHSLVYLPFYLSPDHPLWRQGDGESHEQFINALKLIHPAIGDEHVLGSSTFRAKEVFPIITRNYSDDYLPPMKTSIPHVEIVNSAQIPNGMMCADEIIALANRQAGNYVHSQIT